MMDPTIDAYILQYLKDDTPTLDMTTFSMKNTTVSADIVAKDEGIVAGVHIAERVFELTGCHHVEIKKNDGDGIHPGDIIMSIEGKSSDVLLAERTALNILCRMSGIATKTKRIVEILRQNRSRAIIAGTRKTTPGFGLFEKMAIMIGGGNPHRFNLSGGVMIKDNHIAVYSGNIEQLIGDIRQRVPFGMRIEIEASTPEMAIKAAEMGVDIIMLDNMSPEEGKEVYGKIKKIRPDIIVEVSGGINEDNIMEYAWADVISMGCLTHSYSIIDMALYIR